MCNVVVYIVYTHADETLQNQSSCQFASKFKTVWSNLYYTVVRHAKAFKEKNMENCDSQEWFMTIYKQNSRAMVMLTTINIVLVIKKIVSCSLNNSSANIIQLISFSFFDMKFFFSEDRMLLAQIIFNSNCLL